ncbi:MAG: trypsin-like peptidase domain-containing protein [Pirellulales bacterium]
MNIYNRTFLLIFFLFITSGCDKIEKFANNISKQFGGGEEVIDDPPATITENTIESRPATQVENRNFRPGFQNNASSPTSSGPDPFGDSATPLNTATVSNPNDLSISELIQKVEKSVVRVSAKSNTGRESTVTGLVLDNRGSILTNYLMFDGAVSATVHFSDDQSTKVLGFRFVDQGKDLIVLQIDASAHPLNPLTIANGDPKKGESLLAFGAPLGLNSSPSEGITAGIRSGNETQLAIKGLVGDDLYNDYGYNSATQWIQTTASISLANRGGPLVNMRGELVGINTWQVPSAQNLNFAAHANQVSVMQARLAGQPLKSLTSLPKKITTGVAAVTSSADNKITSTISAPSDIRFTGGVSANEIYRFEGHSDAVFKVEVSDDRRYLATGSKDDKIYVFDLKERKAVSVIEALNSKFSDFSFSGNSRRLITSRITASSLDRYSIGVWDFINQKLVRGTYGYSSSYKTTAIVSSTDGTTLSIGHSNGYVYSKVFSSELSTSVRGYYAREFYGSVITSIALDPSENFLIASASDGKTAVFRGDTYDLNQITGYITHQGSVKQVKVSPDGKVLATVGDGGFKVWSGWKLSNNWKDAWAFKKADDPITCVSFAPNSQLMAAGGSSNKIYLWSRETRSLVQTLTIGTSTVTSVDFLKSGMYLAAGFSDGTVSIIRIDGQSSDNDEFKGASSELITTSFNTSGLESIPSDADLEAAQELLRSIYGEEFASAKTREAKNALTYKLLEQAKKSGNTPPERYALFKVAAKIAASNGNVGLVQQVVRDAGNVFDGSQGQLLALLSDSINTLSTKAQDPKVRKQLILLAMSTADYCLKSDKLNDAETFLNQAQTFADSGLASEIEQKLRDLAKVKIHWDKYQAAKLTLQTSPDDPDANDVVGRYLCFVKGTWLDGLIYLNKSSDPSLAKLAKQDLNQTADAREQAEIGRQWQELSGYAESHEQDAYLAAARYWYLKAEMNLDGLQKAKVQQDLKRLEYLEGKNVRKD